MLKKNFSLTRRTFLKRTAALVAAPYFVPASALGRNGKTPPSQRIVIGGIGIGGRGRHDIKWMLPNADVQFIAVCDVNKSRCKTGKQMVDKWYGNNDCVMYRDMREILSNRSDIDAVVIATGDRWHTLASTMAMRAGKDVYSEKPLTMTISEGQMLVDTAKRYGRVLQTGIQRRSEANFVFADQLARTGMLGQVHTVKAHTLPFAMKHDWLPSEPEPPKDEFDWNLWLGPAPWRPYNHQYLRNCMTWLDYYDFGTGVAGWCSHTICQCQGAIDADLTSAIEYEYPKNGNADGFAAKYANGVKLVLAYKGWRGSCGVRYEGTEGWVSVADGYLKPDVSSPALMKDFDKLVNNYITQTQRPMNHVSDFFDCVKSRRTTVTCPQVAHRSMTTCHAVNICMLLKRNLKRDPTKEEFINDPEANRMRSRAMREPWII